MSQENPLIWIMAGESSGDLYGARIAQEVMKQCPGAVVRGMGGHRMREAGVDAVLIGETLMRAPDKTAKLAELRGSV